MLHNCIWYSYKRWTAVAQWLRCCATNWKFGGSISADINGFFHWHKILPIALWPWGRLSLWQKWVPGAFRGGKGGRCVRLATLPPSCAVMKSGNLKFLGSFGLSRPGMGLIYSYKQPQKWRFVSLEMLAMILQMQSAKFHVKKSGLISRILFYLSYEVNQ